jgi:hypothetical protein
MFTGLNHCYLKWPCYRSWSNQIPTRDFRNPPGPITREKLAKNIAKQVERFIKVFPNEFGVEAVCG